MTEQIDETPVQEGDILAGKYVVERVLGIGGMGVVVAAMHTELEQRVALKFLLPSAAQNPDVVARFAREARAAAKIKSEHVARVSDVGTMDSGLPYIVMEYLEGQDLSDTLLKHGRLLPSKAVDYVLQACEAIAEAHAAGFVHRDLKPSNLFLAHQVDGSEIIKVLDFGISKAVILDADAATAKPGQLTRTSDVFGSPMYMSPEQLKASRDVDHRADIWAIGVILYELVSGKSPFDRNTVAETFGAILYEKPPPLEGLVSDCPPDLEAAIFRCLEKDAAARFFNVAELAKALLPFAVDGTRQSVERTTRVLKRAGMTLATLPPPPPAPPPVAAGTTTLSAPGNTRTSWGAADGAPRSGSSTRMLAIAAVALLGVVAVFAGISRFTRPRAVPSALPDKPVVAQVVSATPAVAPSSLPVSVPSVVPSVTPLAAPSVTASASVSASAGPAASVAPTGPAAGPGSRPVRGKLPPAKGAAAAPPSAAPSPPPAPPPKPEDPNDFGDRK